jgi:predicted double-glycine peptidase
VNRASALLLTGLLAGCGTQVSDRTHFVASVGPVGDYRLPVSSVVDRRYSGVVRQRYDFSCGSAALATLLRYHYGFDVREEVAFQGMWARGDRQQIRRVGFSLLDMKRWLASRGLAADGYKVSLAKVAETGVPGIALIAVRNYRHFVVVKGIGNGEVLIGDPSSGVSVMTIAQFASVWNGIYFVLTADQARAKTKFNQTSQWQSLTRSPIGGHFSDPLSLQALSLTAPFYGDIS